MDLKTRLSESNEEIKVRIWSYEQEKWHKRISKIEENRNNV